MDCNAATTASTVVAGWLAGASVTADWISTDRPRRHQEVRQRQSASDDEDDDVVAVDEEEEGGEEWPRQRWKGHRQRPLAKCDSYVVNLPGPD